MKSCPQCGADLSDARKLAKRSAAELVESLQLDAARLAWCAQYPTVNPVRELEDFKIDMRACGYKLSSGRGGPVKDAWAAFQRRMRTTAQWQRKDSPRVAPQRTLRPVKKEE